jgi:anti-sigma factor RsiW
VKTPRDDGSDWTPDPQLLAAYTDGELEGREALRDLRGRVEAWLDRHPEARAELAALRRLRHLWRETTPPEPPAEAWQRVLDAVARDRAAPAPAPARGRARWPLVTGAAAAACVALLLWWASRPDTPPGNPAGPAVEAVLPLAAADEVQILRVEGADTGTLVVGVLPVHGPLELVEPGEVTFTSVQPDAGDNMMPHVRTQAPHRPMIWAPVVADAAP